MWYFEIFQNIRIARFENQLNYVIEIIENGIRFSAAFVFVVHLSLFIV